MKTVAIIQARMGSARLPGKVMLELGGHPALLWVLRAAHAMVGVDETWVATSTAAADDAIAAWCARKAISVYRGPEGDVLERYAGTIKASRADVAVRITADCPFLDPAVAGMVLRLRAITGTEYACNFDPPSWPDGIDCEVVTAKALLTAAREARLPSEREHVTPFVRNNKNRFPTSNLVAPLPGLEAERWTLDNPEDYALLSAVARALPADRPPSFLEVLAVLDAEPALRQLNRHIARNEGYAKSLAAERVK
jgi:glutamate-1-semialdehyde 2,1-aminomutase/spore coat polysaccharide biosynthesis protein SpsF